MSINHASDFLDDETVRRRLTFLAAVLLVAAVIAVGWGGWSEVWSRLGIGSPGGAVVLLVCAGAVFVVSRTGSSLRPAICTKPLCIQYRASGAPSWAQRLCAISFSWWGKMRSCPPPWISKVTPRIFFAMAEHSMCQPGLPLPQGLSQPGSPSLDGFHSTKSAGLFLYGATSTRAPAIRSSWERRDSWP